MPTLQRPASVGTAFMIPGQSREAACRLDEPTSPLIHDADELRLLQSSFDHLIGAGEH
jgi:hypothetical protein